MKTLKIKAPGRINLLGEHLDYNHGIVLPAAINRYFEFEFSAIEGSFFLIEALDLNEKWEFTWTELTDSTTNGWMNYVKGVFLLIGFTPSHQKHCTSVSKATFLLEQAFPPLLHFVVA
jgi:galactokinase